MVSGLRIAVCRGGSHSIGNSRWASRGFLGTKMHSLEKRSWSRRIASIASARMATQ